MHYYYTSAKDEDKSLSVHFQTVPSWFLTVRAEKTFDAESPFSLALAILGVANAFLTNWIMSKKKRPLLESLAEVCTYARALTRGENGKKR